MSLPAVLVIGASGAVGSALVDELVPDCAAGLLRLVAATRQQEVARSLRDRGAEVCHLDLNDAEMGGLGAIQPVFEGIDRVFLLTGYDVRMLAQSKAAVDAAKAVGVFYDQLVEAGYDPIYMRGGRNYMERIGNGSLTDPADIFDTIETVIGRPATSLRTFLETNRDAFTR